jgi:hypothetical protein
MKVTAFCENVSCSLVEVDRRFRGVYYLHHQGDSTLSDRFRYLIFFASGLFVALMMEAGHTSETSIYVSCCIPGSCHLHTIPVLEQLFLSHELLLSSLKKCIFESFSAYIKYTVNF